MDARTSIQLYRDLERSMNAGRPRAPGVLAGLPERLRSAPLVTAPPVLPDWLTTSEVSYIADRVGAVTYRGQTISPDTDIRGQEGTL